MPRQIEDTDDNGGAIQPPSFGRIVHRESSVVVTRTPRTKEPADCSELKSELQQGGSFLHENGEEDVSTHQWSGDDGESMHRIMIGREEEGWSRDEESSEIGGLLRPPRPGSVTHEEEDYRGRPHAASRQEDGTLAQMASDGVVVRIFQDESSEGGSEIGGLLPPMPGRYQELTASSSRRPPQLRLPSRRQSRNSIDQALDGLFPPLRFLNDQWDEEISRLDSFTIFTEADTAAGTTTVRTPTDLDHLGDRLDRRASQRPETRERVQGSQADRNLDDSGLPKEEKDAAVPPSHDDPSPPHPQGPPQERQPPDDTKKSPRRSTSTCSSKKVGIVAVLVCVIAIVVGITVPLVVLGGQEDNDPPAPLSRAEILQLLDLSGNEGSVQQRAVDWLVDDAFTTTATPLVQLQERYSLAVLHFGTNGRVSWRDPYSFLSDLSVCQWNGLNGGVFCNAQGRVEHVLLARNNLRGVIPSEMVLLENLMTLSLEGNGLIGEIPPTLGSLALLDSLWLFSNNLEGTIPTTFANLSALDTLRLQDNDLVGDAAFLCSSEMQGPIADFQVDCNEISCPCCTACPSRRIV